MKHLSLFLLCTAWAILATAQSRKNIRDYYQAWERANFSGEQAIFKPDLGEVDIANGYCTFAKVGLAQTYGAMAMWQSAGGRVLIGVYSYGCQAGSCYGEIANLKFYDAQMRDITAEVLPLDKIEADFTAKLNRIQARGATGDETFFCKIPQLGTTLKLAIKNGSNFMSSNWEMPIAELVFDSKTGTFLYQRK